MKQFCIFTAKRILQLQHQDLQLVTGACFDAGGLRRGQRHGGAGQGVQRLGGHKEEGGPPHVHIPAGLIRQGAGVYTAMTVHERAEVVRCLQGGRKSGSRTRQRASCRSSGPARGHRRTAKTSGATQRQGRRDAGRRLRVPRRPCLCFAEAAWSPVVAGRSADTPWRSHTRASIRVESAVLRRPAPSLPASSACLAHAFRLTPRRVEGAAPFRTACRGRRGAGPEHARVFVQGHALEARVVRDAA